MDCTVDNFHFRKNEPWKCKIKQVVGNEWQLETSFLGCYCYDVALKSHNKFTSKRKYAKLGWDSIKEIMQVYPFLYLGVCNSCISFQESSTNSSMIAGLASANEVQCICCAWTPTNASCRCSY